MKNNNEAIQWVKKNKNSSCFASNYFYDNKQALIFFKGIYKSGATLIEITNIYDEDWRITEEGGPYADRITIYLPKSAKKSLDILLYLIKIRNNNGIGDDLYFNRKNNTISIWWD